MGDDPRLRTRLDFDQCFGTAVNRFCCQAVVGHPLTLYGSGGQKRGFLPLRDSMQCLTLAVEHPPERGEYRVFNQFEECYTVGELAQLVQTVARESGLDVSIRHIANPRQESESHYYHPDREQLVELGYQPTHDVASEISIMLDDLAMHRTRISERLDILVPDIRWDGTRRRSTAVNGVVAQPAPSGGED